MDNLSINLMLPNALLTSVKAAQLSLPGSDGYMGVLPNHTSLISEIGIGKLSIINAESKDRETDYFVAGGYLEVNDNKADVFLDIAEPISAIDVIRAQAAKERAEKRLQSKSGAFDGEDTIDIARAQAALMRALNRLKLAGNQ